MSNTTERQANAKPRTREEILQIALLMACERVASGPQEFNEANTADGWADIFTEAAEAGMTTDEVLAARAEPRKMTNEERISRGIPIGQ